VECKRLVSLTLTSSVPNEVDRGVLADLSRKMAIKIEVVVVVAV